MTIANYRHRRTYAVLAALALAVTMGAAACGGSTPMSSTNSGTLAGTYNLTVTGTSASGTTTLTHSVTLQLIVS